VTGATLRGLLSRKLRTALTMVAIVLGVAMVAGTYALTDTINAAFNRIFQGADRTIDAVVVPQSAIGGSLGDARPLPASLLGIVRRTPGVSGAEGEIAVTSSIYDLRGDPLGAATGAPTLLFSVASPRFRTTTLVSGRWPRGNELAIDSATFARRHLHLGQVIHVVAAGPAVPR
jgi:putative ABC transport system permease protein